MNLANTIKVMQLKQLQEAEEAAKYPHDMFDPETAFLFQFLRKH